MHQLFTHIASNKRFARLRVGGGRVMHRSIAWAVRLSDDRVGSSWISSTNKNGRTHPRTTPYSFVSTLFVRHLRRESEHGLRLARLERWLTDQAVIYLGGGYSSEGSRVSHHSKAMRLVGMGRGRKPASVSHVGGHSLLGMRSLTTNSSPAPVGTSASLTRSSARTSSRSSLTSSACESTLSIASRPPGLSTRTRSGQ
jgi:hypothetical protein